MSDCWKCDKKNKELLDLMEQRTLLNRKINQLEAELHEIKTAVRVLLRSVDRYA